MSRHHVRLLAALGLVAAQSLYACAPPSAPAPGRTPTPSPSPGPGPAPTPTPDPGAIAESAVAPPPISGGSMAILGTTAVIGDPDSDSVHVVTLRDGRVAHSIALEQGAEPGRVAFDASGRAHVALRRAGDLLTIDLVSGEVLARRAVCPAPRGVVHRASDDTMVVACADGLLGFLAADGSGDARTVRVEDDLRDIVLLADGNMLVSRFRSAEVLTLDGAGAILARRAPPVIHSPFDGMRRPREVDPETLGIFEPDVAWRMLPFEDGAMLLHQRVTISSLGTEASMEEGGYGSGDPCSSIVHGAMTQVPPEGDLRETSAVLAETVLPVDFAFGPDARIAVAAPGRAFQAIGGFGDLTITSRRAPDVFVFDVAESIGFFATAPLPTPESPVPVAADINCFGSESNPNFDPSGGGTVAVAYADGIGWVSFARSPSRVLIETGGIPRTIELGGRDANHLGHELFHAATGAGIACASCHAEGGDDGRTWTFDGIGDRRTQTMRGGLIGTEPFHWDGDMADFSTLLGHVFARRMSGPELSEPEQAVFARWMDALPALPRPSEDPAAVARGAELFASAEVGCASCHAGSHLTNGATVDVGTGGAFQVPTLTGIAHRAPFMHDGCAPTLRDRLLDTTCGGGDMHGRTSALTEAQVDDLVAYLRTL